MGAQRDTCLVCIHIRVYIRTCMCQEDAGAAAEAEEFYHNMLYSLHINDKRADRRQNMCT